MMRLEPDSGGTDEWGETSVREIGWQPAARMAAVLARQLRARYAKKKEEKPRAAGSGGSSKARSEKLDREESGIRDRMRAIDRDPNSLKTDTPEGDKLAKEWDGLKARLGQIEGERKSGGGGGGGGRGGGGKKAAQTKASDAVNAKTGEREIRYNDGGQITVHKDGTATYRAADGSVRKGTYKDPKAKAPSGFKDEPEAKKAKALKAKPRVVVKKQKPVVQYRRIGRTGPPVGAVPY